MAIKRITTIAGVPGRYIGFDTSTGDIVWLAGDTVLARLDNTGALTLTAGMTIADAVSLASTLAVTGATTLTGAVTMASTLAVTGEITGSAGLEVATGLVVGFDGTVTASQVQVGSANFMLDASPTNPRLTFMDSDGDFLQYTLTENAYKFFIGNTSYARILTTGLSIAGGIYVGSSTTAATDNDVTVEGDLILGANQGGLGFASQTFTFSEMTDNGDTTGQIDLTQTIPDGAIAIQAMCHTLTGFTGDTSATIQIGDGTDVDRYNTGTPSVFTTNASGVSLGAVSGTAWHDDAATIRVTITSATDFTAVSAGTITVGVYYWTAGA